MLLAGSVLIGLLVCIVPRFGEYAPQSEAHDFVNHVALAAAALDTLNRTHALPISSDAIQPGIEYPYFVFGNPAFYIAAALVSSLLGVPAHLGVGAVLGTAFAAGVGGMYAVAARAGLNPYLAVAIGLLYATGPYLSLNLFVRNALPEYVAWQALPALLLTVRHGLRPASGPWSHLTAALALAAPFYLHKLIAPHVALALAILALNAAPAPFRRGTLARLGMIGGLALLFTVPAWYPAMRGLDATTAADIGGGLRPDVLHRSWANLFWPYAQDSLPDTPSSRSYQGSFALQLGLVPLVGLVGALWTLLTQPRLGVSQRLPIPLLIFAVNVMLVLGLYRLWEYLPSPLRYVQYAYRLIGLAHFAGFLLLVQSFGTPRLNVARWAPPALRRRVAFAFVGLALAGVATYWQPTRPSTVVASAIAPRDLADYSAFYRRSARGNLRTGGAIVGDRWLAIPPVPVPVEPGTPSVSLSATVPAAMFDQSASPLVVRIYGFSRRQSDASLDRLGLQLAYVSKGVLTPAPISALHDTALGRPTTPGADAGPRPSTRLREIGWSSTLLGETSLAGQGPFQVQVVLDRSIAAVGVECSRAVTANPASPRPEDDGRLCAEVDFLARPNEGDRFVVPQEISPARLARSAYGTIGVDARDLPPGHYLLPTFSYGFVRVVGSDGSPVPTYDFDRRPVIRHAGEGAYTVSYAFEPELLALAAALGAFAAYALARKRLTRRLTNGV